MLGRFLNFYTKYFAIWVVIFGLIAYLAPAPFVSLRPAMDWFFALTMFGIGAVLEADDFKSIMRQPVFVLIGSCAQFTIMPLGAFFAGKVFSLPPELAAGLILTGAAPGAMASNVMSYIAKADVAYSVSLTTASTLLAPILTPGITYLLAGLMLKINFWEMMLSVITVMIVPLFIGFSVKYVFRETFRKIANIFPAISVTFIIFICSLVIAMNKNYLIMVTGTVLVADLCLNIFGMLAGYTVGAVFRMDIRKRRTLAIEIGMQNAGLGVVLALKHFGEKAAIPAAIFVFICILTASVMAEIWQRNSET
jgi:BASS family bile acid:Na+ symporter